MKYGIFFLILTIFFLGELWQAESVAWKILWGWYSLNTAYLARVYLTNSSEGLKKTQKGHIPFSRVVFLAPYLFFTSFTWSLAYVWSIIFSKEPAYNSITDNIVIGRRLTGLERELKAHTTVDLTWELSEGAPPMLGPTYINFPILDGSTPNPEHLNDLLKIIGNTTEPVYIHCAQGHGRTLTISSCLLLYRGLADTPEAAVAMIQKERPLAKANKAQLAFIQTWHEQHKSQA